MPDLIAALTNNQVFSGVVGGSFVVSLLYLLKAVPGSLWSFLVWRFSSLLVVFNEDAAFDRVSEWLAAHEYAKRARQLRLTSRHIEGEGEELQFSPGLGRHLIWYKGRPVFVTRAEPDAKSGGTWKRQEDIYIRTLGSSSAALRDLLADITDARKRIHNTSVSVYLYRSYWKLTARKTKRPLDSVILPDGQLSRVIQSIQRFLDSREWYGRLGIPYRHGVLLEGAPGCGKTSLVMALAGYFSRPLYVLNLGSLRGDNDLIEAMTSVPEYCLLLIEDIDAAHATEKRDTNVPVPPAVKGQDNEDKEEQRKRPAEAAEAEGVSLSALLNSIDGAFAKDGRILIMTTNHPDKIDPALLRPGRADLREHIGMLGAREVQIMCDRFFDGSSRKFAATIQTPITPAELQGQLLARRGRPRTLVGDWSNP
jgi:chaperone BCS1